MGRKDQKVRRMYGREILESSRAHSKGTSQKTRGARKMDFLEEVAFRMNLQEFQEGWSGERGSFSQWDWIL